MLVLLTYQDNVVIFLFDDRKLFYSAKKLAKLCNLSSLVQMHGNKMRSYFDKARRLLLCILPRPISCRRLQLTKILSQPVLYPCDCLSVFQSYIRRSWSKGASKSFIDRISWELRTILGRVRHFLIRLFLQLMFFFQFGSPQSYCCLFLPASKDLLVWWQSGWPWRGNHPGDYAFLKGCFLSIISSPLQTQVYLALAVTFCSRSRAPQ